MKLDYVRPTGKTKLERANPHASPDPYSVAQLAGIAVGTLMQNAPFGSEAVLAPLLLQMN
jgi:hypothetical protein